MFIISHSDHHHSDNVSVNSPAQERRGHKRLNEGFPVRGAVTPPFSVSPPGLLWRWSSSAERREHKEGPLTSASPGQLGVKFNRQTAGLWCHVCSLSSNRHQEEPELMWGAPKNRRPLSRLEESCPVSSQKAAAQSEAPEPEKNPPQRLCCRVRTTRSLQNAWKVVGSTNPPELWDGSAPYGRNGFLIISGVQSKHVLPARNISAFYFCLKTFHSQMIKAWNQQRRSDFNNSDPKSPKGSEEFRLLTNSLIRPQTHIQSRVYDSFSSQEGQTLVKLHHLKLVNTSILKLFKVWFLWFYTLTVKLLFWFYIFRGIMDEQLILMLHIIPDILPELWQLARRCSG